MEPYDFPEKPNLYTKSAIFFAALTLSPFFGALLFAENLVAIGNKRKVLLVAFLAVLWNGLTFKIAADFFQNSPLAYAAGNAIGGLLLIFPAWKQYLGKVLDFQKRSIWSPLLVILFIYALFTALVFWFRK